MDYFPFKLRKPDRWYKRAWMETTDVIKFSIQHKQFEVPKGFGFDGASVPRLFRFLYSPYGAWMIEACIHDYCYKTHCTKKLQADIWFRKGITKMGCPKIIAWLIFLGLQLMGWLYWFKRNEVIDI